MKTSTGIKKAFLVLLCIASLLACKKDDEPNPVNPGKDPEPQPPTEAITAIGAPEGTPVSVMIGKEGGSVTSADGRIKLDIPAGALTSSTNIGIQPVSNKMFNGIGVAYRLTPAGLQLEKPATLTMNYTDTEVNGTTPQALGIAYQNANGGWRFKEDATVNATQKKVSGSIKELKDQALFTKYILVPGQASVQINEGVDLQVRLVSFRIPTKEGEIIVEGEELAPAGKIKSWKLNGQNGPTSGANGSLTGSLGAQMSYKAPASVPAQNPVAVSVEMDGPSGSKIILVSNITVKMFKWAMDVEWLRTSTCSPGAIGKFTYTATTRIEFELDTKGKITNVVIKGEEDGMVSTVESCLPDFYTVTGEATGIHITDLVGGIDPQTGKLDFGFKGDWMDFPTLTLHYKDGSSSVTDESYQTFEGINFFTKMPLKDGEELNIRNAEPTGFIFRLTTMEK
jgi:hypothetical protein